jgi:hypothetical protein
VIIGPGRGEAGHSSAEDGVTGRHKVKFQKSKVKSQIENWKGKIQKLILIPET